MDKYLWIVNKQKHYNKEAAEKFNYVPYQDEDGESFLEEKTYAAYNELAEYLKQTYGIVLEVISAGRSLETQQSVYDHFLAKRGQEWTENHVALPGTSEHHTGLALDVNPHGLKPKMVQKLIDKTPALKRYFDKQERESGKLDEMYHTLHNVLPYYGFILRYTDDKKPITGYNGERWHIRFVGKELAQEITDSGLCLEEFVKKLEQQKPAGGGSGMGEESGGPSM